jgi:hypothetical protein
MTSRWSSVSGGIRASAVAAILAGIVPASFLVAHFGGEAVGQIAELAGPLFPLSFVVGAIVTTLSAGT